MDTVKILEVKQSIFASNDEQAEALRKELKKKKVFLLNLMSAPGLVKLTFCAMSLTGIRAFSDKSCTILWSRSSMG